MNRIDNLLRKLIDNTATPQELEELKELMNKEEQVEQAGRLLDEQFEIPRSEAEGLTQQEKTYMIENMVAASRSRLQKSRSLRLPLTIAASVALIASVAWIYIVNFVTPATDAARDLTATYSGKDYLHLPDGSTVFLNEGSELSYSITANGREVKLTGEAFFDVVHDASRPFIVHTGKVSTRVLGTAFNVKAYPNQKEVLVAVTRGKVQVGNDTRTYTTLLPDEQLAVDTQSDNFAKTTVNTQTTSEWKERFLILDDVTLEEAAEVISKKYSVEITFERPELKECGVYAKFLNDESVVDVLEVVSTAVSVEYTFSEDGREVTISGKGCD